MVRLLRPFRDFALAITQLTVVPLPVRWPADERPDVASYYVWVGLLIGAVAYVPLKALQLLHLWWHSYPALAAALVLVIWALFTRFMHWDALADVADGWFGESVQRRQEIASDSSVGAFGATSIALVAVLEYGALTGLLTYHESIVLMVPAFARLAATAAAWLGTPAKPDGLGASVVRKPSFIGFLAAAAGTLFVCLLIAAAYRWPGVAVGVLGLVLSLVVPHLIARRFGGVTGDVMGASILIVEVVLFVVAAVVV